MSVDSKSVSPANLAHGVAATPSVPLPPRLLFGLRLAASVCLALYVTYFLELPNPFWAATTAAIVCQPNLGASLQKGRFRAQGTCIGALVLVSLLALFPQDRMAFLFCLALWCGLCGAAVVLLRASAAYGAALSGITAAILFADSIADPTSAFLLGLNRVSEIGIGILAAAVVMLLTEPGAARHALAGLMERTALQLQAGFLQSLTDGETPHTLAARRDVAKALTPLALAMDAAEGESAALYARRGNLRSAISALVAALLGWRTLGVPAVRQDMDTATLRRDLASRLAHLQPGAPERQAQGARLQARHAIADMANLPQTGVASRLLVEATRDVAACLLAFMDAVVLLRTADGQRVAVPRQPFAIADSLPALVAGVRAILSLLAVTLVWIETAWPNGPLAIAFAVVSTLVFASFADEAHARAADYAIGVAVMALLGSILYFYVLPALSTFAGLMGLLVLLFVPLGVMQMGPWHSTLFLAMSISSLPLLGMGNPEMYDPAGYFNVAFAIVAGSAAGPLFFILLPPPAPERRARRLIGLSVRDLRRLIRTGAAPNGGRWRAVLTRRLESIPPQASAEQHGALLALLAMGLAIEKLRATVAGLEALALLASALAALEAGQVPAASVSLNALDRLLEVAGPDENLPIRVQVAVLVDALSRHAALLAQPPRAVPSFF